MKVLVLGGCGIQGRTALYDLARDERVDTLICADIQLDTLSLIRDFTPMDRITQVVVDAEDKQALIDLYKQVDVVIDLLPVGFKTHVNTAALETRTPVVNTNYLYDTESLDRQAKEAGIAILPECGLDPGIDLVIYQDAARKFDRLSVINSYCGGFPEAAACDNPLNYKVSWTWRGVLNSTRRDGCIIRNGERIEIPGAHQHDAEYVHMVDFPGLGPLEAIPNGDAVFFTDRLGITDTIETTGRYSLRWPGWSAFWRPMKELGFLSDDPIPGLGDGTLSPMDFMDKFLGPKLAYGDGEKDVAAMLNIFEGTIDDRPMRYTVGLYMDRDLEKGLTAMSQGVAYTACIVAKMIVRGEIPETGVLSPLSHVPADLFMERLKKRGITVTEKMEEI